MLHHRTPARTLAGAVAGLAVALSLGVAPAQANTLDLTWDVDTKTTLKKIDETVKLPTGKLEAKIDTATGKMTGDLKLPKASKKIELAKLPLATVTVALTQAGPIKGKVNMDAGTARAQAKFNIRVVSIKPIGAPAINLVKASARPRSRSRPSSRVRSTSVAPPSSSRPTRSRSSPSAAARRRAWSTRCWSAARTR